MKKRWVINTPPEATKIEELSKKLNCHPVIANLLLQRGITSSEQAQSFFYPSLNMLHDPFLMKDMDKAVEWLRENGLAKAAKKSGRIAAEGMVAVNVAEDGKSASIVEVNSETDFVAKNEKFQNFVAAVAEQAVNSDNTELEAFLDEAWHEEPSKTVKEVLVEQIAVIGENLKIRRFQKVTAPLVVSYTHGGGRIGVLVEADTDVKNDAVKEALTNVAMQIAALSPKYVSTADVSEEYKAHEKEILMAQIQNDPKMAGKPEKVIEGAVSGRLNKELKEVCLLEQVYVKAEDGKQTVAQYLAQVAKENNANLTVKGFVRFETGEGIEKKVEDFAAEVAAQLG